MRTAVTVYVVYFSLLWAALGGYLAVRDSTHLEHWVVATIVGCALTFFCEVLGWWERR